MGLEEDLLHDVIELAVGPEQAHGHAGDVARVAPKHGVEVRGVDLALVVADEPKRGATRRGRLDERHGLVLVPQRKPSGRETEKVVSRPRSVTGYPDRRCGRRRTTPA